MAMRLMQSGRCKQKRGYLRHLRRRNQYGSDEASSEWEVLPLSMCISISRSFIRYAFKARGHSWPRIIPSLFAPIYAVCVVRSKPWSSCNVHEARMQCYISCKVRAKSRMRRWAKAIRVNEASLLRYAPWEYSSREAQATFWWCFKACKNTY